MSKFYRPNKETGEMEEVYDSLTRSPGVHSIHLDEMAPVEHPATGKIFTSRAKFDAETIASGCVPIHGNDRPVKRWESNAAKEEREHKQFSDSFDRAYNDLDNNMTKPARMKPETEALWRKIHGNGNS